MLPKLETPTYQIELPLSKKIVKYRPFLVKEQKTLLMAMEAQDSSSIHQAINDILHNCTLTEGIVIEKLPIIDIEYYFINLRAKSVGEVIESKYKCNNVVDDKVCGNIMDADINLLDITVEGNGSNPEIQLTDNIVVKLKYPEFSIVKDSINMQDMTEVTFNMIASSIESIYDGEQFHYASESTHEELLEFVESMNQQQFNKVEEFFTNLPELNKVVEMDCRKCGFHHKLKIEGLENFFD